MPAVVKCTLPDAICQVTSSCFTPVAGLLLLLSVGFSERYPCRRIAIYSWGNGFRKPSTLHGGVGLSVYRWSRGVIKGMKEKRTSSSVSGLLRRQEFTKPGSQIALLQALLSTRLEPEVLNLVPFLSAFLHSPTLRGSGTNEADSQGHKIQILQETFRFPYNPLPKTLTPPHPQPPDIK